MITIWDYIVIGFYMLFMFLMGSVFKRANKNTSDYFRGSGKMLWWMVGASAMMGGFSAYTFTGMASEAYRIGFGLTIMMTFTGVMVQPFLIFMAPIFRRLRVVTFLEIVKQRFGTASEQLYLWSTLPTFVIASGVQLFAGSFFISAVFEVDINLIILISGVTVVFMSMTGGSWAVIASDFIQLLVLVSICGALCYKTLTHPELGGLEEIWEKGPAQHRDWGLYIRPKILIPMFISNVFLSFLYLTNVADRGVRFLAVKDEPEAKKAALFFWFQSAFMPMLFTLPPVACAVLYPDLTDLFPALKNPEEGAYVAMAMLLLPKGLLGLLICGIFAANMSAMDTGLNRCSGIFVRDFYARYINREASEHHKVRIGQATTAFLGMVMMGIAAAFFHIREMNLYDVYMHIWGVVGTSLGVPMIMAIVVRKTPPWSCWSTVIVGVVTTTIVQSSFSIEYVSSIFNLGTDFTSIEISRVRGIAYKIPLVICILWFLFTTRFYKGCSDEHKKNVDKMTSNMKRPIVHDAEETLQSDAFQHKILGILCMIYGGFSSLGVFIPNTFQDRMLFLACGCFIGGVGAILYAVYHFKFKALVLKAEPAA